MIIKDDDKPYWLALWRVPRIGPVAFNTLLSQCEGDLPALFALSAAGLKAFGLQASQIECIKQFKRSIGSATFSSKLCNQVDDDVRWLESSEQHHLLLAVDENNYPPLLLQVAGAPPLLFVKGDKDALMFPQIAMVGSRNPTRLGKETAFEFAQYFARQGFITTSGLALGIDSASHQGALAADGFTVAVLAHGLDHLYPKANQMLADKITSQGALVSEYPIGTGPRPEYFPRRNRIVSGLSLGVLIVEGAKKSGSLITAREAAQQGREVFAIPGSIHNPLAKGCHDLIRQGAKLVENGEHVLEELLPLLATYNIGLNRELMAADDGSVNMPNTVENRVGYAKNSVEGAVLSVLEYDACSVDFVVAETGMSAAQVSSALIMLELDGAIVNTNSGYLLA